MYLIITGTRIGDSMSCMHLHRAVQEKPSAHAGPGPWWAANSRQGEALGCRAHLVAALSL
jgi:hypothetical protein